MKNCRICKIEKPLTDYHRQPKGADGYEASCKECRNRMKRESKYVDGEKQCTKCRKFKKLTEYCLKAGERSGYNRQCKQCAALYQKNRNAARAKPKNPHKIGQKTCSGCGQTKDYSSFPRSRSCRDGYVAKCKSCYTTTKKKSIDINYAAFYYPIALD